jgi:hypothetical protein
MPYRTGQGAIVGAPPDQQLTDRRASHPEPTAPEGAAVAAGLRRRRAASWRCGPLPDGGRRDALDPAPSGRPTAREREAWQAAAAHLRTVGYVPIVPAAVCRAPRCHCGGW